MAPLHPGWQIVGLLAAMLFFGMAITGVVRGRFEDPETGLCDRTRNPVLFWVIVGVLTLLGLYLLAVSLGFFSWSTGSAPW
jgi:hypothetical protein